MVSCCLHLTSQLASVALLRVQCAPVPVTHARLHILAPVVAWRLTLALKRLGPQRVICGQSAQVGDHGSSWDAA